LAWIASGSPAAVASADATRPPPGPYSSITGSISAARCPPANAGGVTVIRAPAAAGTSKANQSLSSSSRSPSASATPTGMTLGDAARSLASPVRLGAETVPCGPTSSAAAASTIPNP
jgi:hypothetical protein